MAASNTMLQGAPLGKLLRGDSLESSATAQGSWETSGMKLVRTTLVAALALLAAGLAAVPRAAFAQTDEIQVYDAEIEQHHKVNVTLHNNFTPIGRTTAVFPGGIIPNHSENGGVELAYGVKDWFEQGLYLPIFTAYSPGRDGTIDGLKIRELFVRPHARDHKFFYGVNFEFSFNYPYWETRTFTAEVRPIVGFRVHAYDFIVNPIVDTDYSGGPGGLEFVPAMRVDRNLTKKWAVAIEEYDDDGPLHSFLAFHKQFHEVWGVTDFLWKSISIESGVGVEVTSGADRLTLKLMFSRDVN